MRLTITIDMDNGAFCEREGHETARILRECATFVDGHAALLPTSYMLRDVNGNRVGGLVIKEN